MPLQVAQAVASDLELNGSKKTTVVWHGGEPLATGLSHLEPLLGAFEKLRKQGRIRHAIQTNATLITDDWCQLFKEKEFVLGVSLDGDEQQNSDRITWSGNPSYSRVMKSIELLRKNELSFSVIAVVHPKNIGSAASFYAFFKSIGCHTLCLNIEEYEGANNAQASQLATKDVKRFWKELFEAWRADPVIKVRELDYALSWMRTVDAPRKADSMERDFWPTVSVDGDLVVLSPELAATEDKELERFVVGNVLQQGLCELVTQSLDSWYVRDYFAGVDNCKAVCDYFEFCGGGYPSNKWFEAKDLTVTETAHCRNCRKCLIDSLLESLSNSQHFPVGGAVA